LEVAPFSTATASTNFTSSYKDLIVLASWLGFASVSMLSFALALLLLPLYLAGAIMPHTPPPSSTSSRDAAHHQECS